MPRNLSPSPYSPLPVLKNRDKIFALSGFCKFSSSEIQVCIFFEFSFDKGSENCVQICVFL